MVGFLAGSNCVCCCYSYSKRRCNALVASSSDGLHQRMHPRMARHVVLTNYDVPSLSVSLSTLTGSVTLCPHRSGTPHRPRRPQRGRTWRQQHLQQLLKQWSRQKHEGPELGLRLKTQTSESDANCLLAEVLGLGSWAVLGRVYIIRVHWCVRCT